VKAARLSIVLSLLIVVLTSLTGSQVQIEGKVSATRPEIANCIMLVKVVARQGSRVLASGHELLDTTGVYVLPINAGITPTQQRPVDIFVAGLGLDTMYVKSYYSFTGSRMVLSMVHIIVLKELYIMAILHTCHSIIIYQAKCFQIFTHTGIAINAKYSFDN